MRDDHSNKCFADGHPLHYALRKPIMVNKAFYLFDLQAEATAGLSTVNLSAGSDKEFQTPGKNNNFTTLSGKPNTFFF